MGSLRTTSDQLDGEFELEEGSIKIGRSRDNQIRLPHKSVSRHHAVAVEQDGVLTVKDLASTYGTYINEDKITEGQAEDGDIIRFGRIRMVYERAAQTATTPSPSRPEPASRSVPAAGESEGRPCDKHPGKALTFVCPKCRLRFCDACVKKLEVSGAERSYCPYCKEACKPIGLFQIEEDRRQARESRTFFRSLPAIFGHPFSGDGIPLLLIGTVIYLALVHLARYSVYLVIPPALYLAALVHNIVATAAEGDEELPGWPNPADAWEAIVRPALMFSLSLAVAGIPLLAYLWWTIDTGMSPSPSITFPLGVWALLYLPVAVLATGTSDNFAGVNPLVFLSAFSRLYLQFMTAAVLLLLTVTMRFVIANVATVFLTIPVLPELITGFVSVCLLMIMMRLWGTLYYTNRRELGWHTNN